MSIWQHDPAIAPDVSKYDYLTYNIDSDGEIILIGWDSYPSHSVLAGQARKNRLCSYSDTDKLHAHFPDVNGSSKWTEAQATVAPCPPSDWDPMDAGEHWGEDDY